MALEERLFAKVRRDRVHGHVGAYQAGSGRLEAVDAAETGAEVAVAQVSVGLGALLGGFYGAEELVAWEVIIEQIRRCKV